MADSTAFFLSFIFRRRAASALAALILPDAVFASDRTDPPRRPSAAAAAFACDLVIVPVIITGWIAVGNISIHAGNLRITGVILD